MPEKVVIGSATLWHANCLEVLPGLPKHDLLCTDPPYGIGAVTAPYLFPAYGQWTGAKQALDIATRDLNEAEVRWLKLLGPALAEPLLRELAESKGLLPKAKHG